MYHRVSTKWHHLPAVAACNCYREYCRHEQAASSIAPLEFTLNSSSMLSAALSAPTLSLLPGCA